MNALTFGTLSIGSLVILQPMWIVVSVLLAILAWRWNESGTVNDWQAVMSPEVFDFLSGKSERKRMSNWLLWAASIVALGMSQPVSRQSDDDTWRHSIGWIAVVDVSRSMTLSDTVPSRLSAARQALMALSSRSGARSISLVIYSGDAFMVAPPAFDKSVFNEHAALLNHGVIEAEGSNLARALSLATSIISDSGFIASRVFVLTDTGGINASSVAASAYLAENGHQLDALVFGSTAASDQTSPTAVQAALADDLARAGKGHAVFANGFGVVDYDALALDDQATASTHADLKALVWKDQSHWLLLISVPLLLLQFYRERRL